MVDPERLRYRRLTRQILDNRLLSLGPSAKFTPPAEGWVNAIRFAINMSATELGARMGVSEGSVRALERSDCSGVVRVASLRRAAEAMDCTAVFALIPNRSLEYTARLREAASSNPELTSEDYWERYMPRLNVGKTFYAPELTLDADE